MNGQGVVAGYQERHARGLIVEALADTRVVLIAGARQVGKSTLARAIAATEWPASMVSLDDAATLHAATNDPTAFIQTRRGPVLIDEVQRVPELLLAIKHRVDRDPSAGQFLLTGSADVLSNPRVKDALTGRMETVPLWPFSQAEFEGTCPSLLAALFACDPPAIEQATVGREAFIERVVRGGFPDVSGRTGRRRDQWFESYVDSALTRDLAELASARRLDVMPRLLRVIAGQAAGEVNYQRLASEFGIDAGTVRTYLTLLESIYLIRRVRPWAPNVRAREIRAPKVYVVDSGMHAFLVDADVDAVRSVDALAGRAFENFVAMEVARQLPYGSVGLRQYHYRTKLDEIDIVVEDRAGNVVAIEVKASATIASRDHRALNRLRDAIGSRFRCGVVIYTGAQTIPLGERIFAMPVEGLWR